MKKKLLFIIFLLSAIFSFAQKYIQVETVNRLKVKRYTIGESMTFRLKGKTEWYTRDVTNIIPEQNIILFDNMMIKTNEIEAFRFERSFIQGFAKQLYKFGGAWLLYASFDHLVARTDFVKSDFIVPATSVGLAFVLQKTFKHKYTHFGGRKRLRLIDLSFK
jgi:hypothetical protein